MRLAQREIVQPQLGKCFPATKTEVLDCVGAVLGGPFSLSVRGNSYEHDEQGKASDRQKILRHTSYYEDCQFHIAVATYIANHS